MDPLLGALLVFCLRIVDVSIGTVRVLYVIRGQRLVASVLAVIESGVFITAISTVFAGQQPWFVKAAYATGFAAGTALGMTVEKWIGTGEVLARVISKTKCAELRDVLLAAGFGVTAVAGRGREGEVLILFIVCPRRRFDELLKLTTAVDAHAFITGEPVSHAAGGYLRHVPTPSTVRK